MAAAGVELQAEEPVRIDGLAVEAHALGLAELRQRLQHLAFEPLHELQRHVEKVAGAAGGIEHPRGAELAMERAHDGNRRLLVAGERGLRLQRPEPEERPVAGEPGLGDVGSHRGLRRLTPVRVRDPRRLVATGGLRLMGWLRA